MGSYFTLKNGERLYYLDMGDGPDTVVMMHGWTSSHEIFVKPAEELSDRARCIMFDLRGHGNSRYATQPGAGMETLASDLNELITGLGLSNVTLLGWSMGACAAMNYVRLYGCSALKQLVLCDMTPKMINDETWDLGLYQGAYTKDDYAGNEGKDIYEIYKIFAKQAVPKLRKIPGFLLTKPLKEILDKCDGDVLMSLSASMSKQDNRDVMGMITVPFTYFYADPGSIFSPELAKWYGEFVTVPYHAVPFPDSDHMLISNYPEKFAEELGKLL